jgi:hypothetical protein
MEPPWHCRYGVQPVPLQNFLLMPEVVPVWGEPNPTLPLFK